MDFSTSEIFLAYRQAKTALPHEQHGLASIRFASDEVRIDALIERLRQHFRSTPSWFSGLSIGEVWLIPKKAELRSEPQVDEIGRVSGSAVRRVDVRVHLTPTLNFATAEVLWLWQFGPALEALLSPAVRANRLQVEERGRRVNTVDQHSRWLFKYWEPAYKGFRDDAFKRAKELLTSGPKGCLLTTFDLASYYDELDPSFLLTDQFVSGVIAKAAQAGVSFDSVEYRRATAGLLRAFKRYQRKCTAITGLPANRGIPIGCLTSKVISNVALATLDEFIQSKGPAFYARYVDDLLIVSSPLTGYRTPDDVAARFLPLKASRSQSALVLDEKHLARPGSRLRLQRNKLRAHALHGQGGMDYLGIIERDIRLIVSERRAFLPPDGLGSLSPLTALFIGTDHKAPIQVLREADSLKVSRYAAGTVLSRVAVGVRLLRPPEASSWCEQQLQSLIGAIVDSHHWIDFFDYGFRAFGTSIRAWNTAIPKTIINSYETSLADLASARGGMPLFWNARRLNRNRSRFLIRWVYARLREELCKSIPLALVSKHRDLSAFLRELRPSTTSSFQPFSTSGTARAADLLARADLRTEDRETDLTDVPAAVGPVELRWSNLHEALREDERIAQRLARVEHFIAMSREIDDVVYSNSSALEVLLMSHPPSMFDVAYRCARARRDPSDATDIINAIRGTHYWSTMFRSPGDSILDASRLNTKRSPIIILGNLPVRDSWSAAAVNGIAALMPDRANDLNQVVNAATFKRHRTKRDVVLVLPELSVPHLWLRQLADRLISEKVNFVAGLEYRRIGNQVINEAVGVFTTGYGTAAVCLWPKTRPARKEFQILQDLHVSFMEHEGPRWLVNTDFGAFSVLICSELLDVERWAQLRGRVDGIFVPAWNKDTATFDHSIQTTASDVHCYIAIANNAKFSDCRVYVPAYERHERDVCRLLLREDAATISATIDIMRLRRFQLASISNKMVDQEIFKPIPPGFIYQRP